MYEDMSLEELEAENLRLQDEKEKIRRSQLALNRVYSQKVTRAEAARKAATMSDDEKRALLQVIAAEGIASEEGVGSV